MWKLDKLDFRKINTVYVYSLLVLFLIPFFMHILRDTSLNIIIYGLGYGLFYAVIGYPLLILIYVLTSTYCRMLKSRMNTGLAGIFYILSMFGLVYLYVRYFYDFSIERGEIAQATVYCSIVLFLGYLNFDRKST